MKLSGKLMIAPLVAIGFLVALALAGYYALTLQQSAADNFYQGIFTRYASAVATETTVGKVHAGIYRLLNIGELQQVRRRLAVLPPRGERAITSVFICPLCRSLFSLSSLFHHLEANRPGRGRGWAAGRRAGE